MTKEERQRLERDVIAWINRVREQLDLPPIKKLSKGLPRESQECPIAISLARGSRFHADVRDTMYRVYDVDYRLVLKGRLSRPAMAFVKLFDFPDLNKPLDRYMKRKQ